jgi:uncharacterized membrane protein YfcA
MIAVVALIIFKPNISISNIAEQVRGKRLIVALVVFFFIGVYGGFINAGIGFVILLFLVYHNKLSLVKANATKVTIVCIYTLAAVVLFAFNDKISWVHGIVLAAGNMIGAWISSRLAVKKGDGYIKIFLIVMVTILAIKLWFF